MAKQQKNTAELSEMLMQHTYFSGEPGKSMTRLEISHIINAHIQRKGAYHVERSEIERCIKILLSDEYQYDDPVSIMSNIKTFSFGICQLEDTSYRKRKHREQEQRHETWQYQDWKRQYNHRYNNDPAFRQDVKNYREKYGAVRRNDNGDMEIYDESYYKCWCVMQDWNCIH